jgi:hypothetical protein
MTTITKVLAAMLFCVTTAWAGDSSELDAAMKQQHEASARVWYHEMQTTIANRDIATANIALETATTARQRALNEHRTGDADQWGKRIAQAQRDEREAQNRSLTNRHELERARGDLQASTDQVRRLERVAGRR